MKTIARSSILAFAMAASLTSFALPAASADEAALELARDFIALSRLDQHRSQMIEIVNANIQASLADGPMLNDGSISEENRTEFFALMQDELATALQELSGPLDEQMIAFYADRFTKDELITLIDIYKSPVFNKQLDLMPELLAQNNEIVRSRLGDLQTRMAERIEAWIAEQNRE